MIGLGDLSSSLGFLLRIAQVQIYETFFEECAADGLRPGAFTVLRVIGLNPDVRQGTIAKRLQIKPAHMTKLVQHMVEKGFVRRTTPASDRRSILLSLTRKGEVFLEKNRAAFATYEKIERGNLNDHEYATIVRLLGKLTGMKQE